jgi:hypothetical protein
LQQGLAIKRAEPENHQTPANASAFAFLPGNLALRDAMT